MNRSGMTEEEAIKQVSEYQRTFSKEKCIEKYGLELGLIKWEERQNKWQESLHKSKNLHVHKIYLIKLLNIIIMKKKIMYFMGQKIENIQ